MACPMTFRGDKMAELVRSGMTLSEVARKYKVSKAAVQKAAARRGIKSSNTSWVTRKRKENNGGK